MPIHLMTFQAPFKVITFAKAA